MERQKWQTPIHFSYQWNQQDSRSIPNLIDLGNKLKKKCFQTIQNTCWFPINFFPWCFSPPKTWTRLQYLKKPGPSSPVTWRYSASLGFNRSGCRLFPGSSKLLELNEPDFWTSNKSTGRRQPSQDSPHEFLVVVFQPQAIWKSVRKSNFGSFFHHISEWTLNHYMKPPIQPLFRCTGFMMNIIHVCSGWAQEEFIITFHRHISFGWSPKRLNLWQTLLYPLFPRWKQTCTYKIYDCLFDTSMTSRPSWIACCICSLFIIKSL